MMTQLDFDTAENAMNYLYFVAHKLRFLREDVHGEPGMYFVTARYVRNFIIHHTSSSSHSKHKRKNKSYPHRKFL